MNRITFSINEQLITIDRPMTILKAALENGIYIPHLCHHPDLAPVGVCRLCMVEIKDRGVVISCNTPAKEGLVIKTRTPEIDKMRRSNVELLLINNLQEEPHKFSGKDNQLKKIADYMGISKKQLKHLRHPKKEGTLDTSNPFFNRDPDKCVLCGICVRTCEEIQGCFALDYLYRGYSTTVGTFLDKPIKESTCESCAECVIRCPVDALMLKKFEKPSREIKTICIFCGVGCGFYLGVNKGEVVNVRGDRDNPINRGRLCVKGRFGYEFIHHPERLKTPLIKKKGKFVKASWDEALELIAKKFSSCKDGEFATLSSAKCTNEENYIIQKFTRSVMSTNNIDHCARLCHAPTVAGLAQSFGSGAMTNSINEIGQAKTIFAIGTNTTAAHPIIGTKIRNAVKHGVKLIVANPKEIDLCKIADIFLQQKPGSDVALLMGIMRVIVDEGLEDKDFIGNACENFPTFRESLKNYPLDFVERISGVPREKIIAAARLYAGNKPSSILYAMGITQHTHGTDNVLATSNLALLTGNIGKPASGVNPLRGQNNVQGACDLGALPNVYPGYQKVDDPLMQEKFQKAWNCQLSAKVGLTHLEIFDAIYERKIKMLYLVGENPVLSEANANHVKEAIKRLDFFVAQDLFLSESAQLADVVLPAASFAEKDGTFTNTERRVQRIRKAIEPLGESKPDWLITSEIAKRLGAKGFDFKHPVEIMDELTALTPSYHGISYERIEEFGLQWPCPDKTHAGTQFLHSEKFATKNGKGKFMPLVYKPPKELPDKKYPLVLTTDRSLYHFHTGTLTRRVKGLEALEGFELLNINPEDAHTFGIKEGQKVGVASRRGKIKVKVKLTEKCPRGVVSLTFHYHEVPTNVLTNAAFDPIAKIPETKVCAVRIEKTSARK